VVAVRFEVAFHTPFRVASGRASDGSDTAVDLDALLPASSLKGLMRSAAHDLLGLPDDQVGMVFGNHHRPSPWSWSDGRVAGGGGDAEVRSRARIRIGAATSTVVRGALLIADEVHAAWAEFSIDRTGWIEAGDMAEHEAVLLAAARAVTAVGGDRVVSRPPPRRDGTGPRRYCCSPQRARPRDRQGADRWLTRPSCR
jgi:hypothetical protein